MSGSVTSKMLGDAGEHFVLSQFTFAGKPAVKMPEGWSDYDLAVETGHSLVRISVKTRSESAGWKTSKWFMFNEDKTCEWLVFVFQSKNGPIRAWIIPFEEARKHANNRGAARKNPNIRDVSWSRLTGNGSLACYENNWHLHPDPRQQPRRTTLVKNQTKP